MAGPRCGMGAVGSGKVMKGSGQIESVRWERMLVMNRKPFRSRPRARGELQEAFQKTGGSWSPRLVAQAVGRQGGSLVREFINQVQQLPDCLKTILQSPTRLAGLKNAIPPACYDEVAPMKTKTPRITPEQHRQLLASISDRAKRAKHGVQDLSRNERVFYAVTTLHDTIVNSGLEHFISKHSKDVLSDAIMGLALIGADQTRAALLRAASLLQPVCDINSVSIGDPCGLPHDAFDQEEAEIFTRQHLLGELGDLDDLLLGDPDQLADRLDEFVYRQNLLSTAGK